MALPPEPCGAGAGVLDGVGAGVVTAVVVDTSAGVGVGVLVVDAGAPEHPSAVQVDSALQWLELTPQ